MNVDVDLARAIHDEAEAAGLPVKMMENPDFRVDYGTITTGHLFNPDWDKPLVVISSNRSTAYYSVEVMQEIMIELGRVTRKAIEASGKKVVVLASNSLSHRHFTTEACLCLHCVHCDCTVRYTTWPTLNHIIGRTAGTTPHHRKDARLSGLAP